MNRRSRRLRWKIVPGWLIANACIACHAQVVAREPLTRAMVVQAFHVRGVDVNAANVHLPMSIYVAGPAPALTVLGVDRETGDRLRVRLRCSKTSDCVAFVVSLDADGMEADAILALAAPTASARAGSVMQAVVLHAGDRLTLSIEQEHGMLQMPCVAIDTGSVGATVRVSTLDRRKSFYAIVTGPAAAKGVSE